MMEARAQAAVQRLVQLEGPDREMKEEILTCGDVAGPWLHEAMGQPGVTGPAKVMIMELLAELRYTPAIPALLSVIDEEPFWDAPVRALRSFGADAVPALLPVVRHRPHLLEVLAECASPPDPDVREVLMSMLWELPGHAARALRQLGDPESIPALLSRLATVTIDRRELFAGQEILALIEAVEALGGDAGALGRQREAQVYAARQPHAERISRLHEHLEGALVA